MKVLLDENLDPRLRGELNTHDVITTVYAGWGGLRNGELLQTAEVAGFDVFITAVSTKPRKPHTRDCGPHSA